MGFWRKVGTVAVACEKDTIEAMDAWLCKREKQCWGEAPPACEPPALGALLPLFGLLTWKT